MGKTKKPPIIEYYPVYKPAIKVPFPEMADVIEKLSGVEASMDKNVEITRECAWHLYEVAVHIKETPTREYYVGVIRKWLSTEPKPPKTTASNG